MEEGLGARSRMLGALLLVTGVALGCLPGCGGGSSSGDRMEYHMALAGEIKSFDPQVSNGVPSSRIQGAIFEGLLQYHYLDRPYRLVPALAEGMPVTSEDGLEVTIRVKQGVRFHDDPCFGGKPHFLDAADFVHAWKRLADPKLGSPGWWIFDGRIVGLDAWREAAREAGTSDYDAPVEGLATPAPHTLVIRLTRPFPQLHSMLTMHFAAPMPREATEFYQEEILNHPVGTGPFRLKRFVPNSQVVLERFEHYRPETYPTTGSAWARENGLLADAGKRLPFLDRIVYEIIVEPQPAWLKFRAGQLDRATIPKDNFEGVMASSTELGEDMKRDGIHLQIWPGEVQWWIGMNLKAPVFQGERGLHLRRAIAYSHDAEKFLRVLQNGRGVPATSIFPPMLPAHDPEKIEFDYSYNPEKAREELVAAGFSGGEGAPVLKFDLRGSGALSRQIAEFVKRGLEEIGLRVELVSNTWPEFLRKANAGQLEVYWGGWVGDYPDEENWLQLLYGPNGTPGPNFANYANPEYDALYERIQVMADSPERRSLIQRMNNLALRDCPWRMSFTGTNYVLHHRWLKNFQYADPIYNWQKYLRVDMEDRARGL